MAAPWTVHGTGPLERVEDDLWLVDGSVPRMSLRRRMALVRLSDGRVVVHSAINLPEPDMAALEAWGRPAFLVVPNGFHRLDAPAWKARYPDLVVVAPSGSAARVAQRVPVDGGWELLPADPHLAAEPLDGVGEREAALRVTAGGRVTLVFADVLFNVPHQGGFGGLMLRLMGSSGGPRVTRLARAALVKDRARLRASLERLAALPGLARLVPGHGDVIEGDAAGVLREVGAAL